MWSKYLSLLLGSSIHGVATVVAAFLGGLGIGAFLGGRLAARTHEPLLAYARIELLVAGFGLASPLAIRLARPLFSGLYALLEGGFAFLLVRFLVLFAALLLPTLAMGATLPLLASDRARRGRPPEEEIARLYATNTAGAVAGVLLSGFVSIPLLGLGATAALASVLDLLVAGLMLRARPAAPPKEAPARRRAAGERSGAWFDRFVLPAFALSGFTAILYEIAWTRILSVPLGGMVYALSLILALYLVGIALGSALAERMLRAGARPVMLFGVLQTALAASVVLGGHLFSRIPGLVARAIHGSAGSVVRFFSAEAAITALVVLAPTILLGALFPAAAAIRARRRTDAAHAVGAIYAANTAGSIAGALLTGFLLLPTLGSLGSILLAAATNLALGIAAILGAEGEPRRRRLGAVAILAGALVLAGVGLPRWEAQRMSLGLTRLLRTERSSGSQAVQALVENAGRAEGGEELLFQREGRHASVAVLRAGNRVALLVNGKPDATIGSPGDMTTQVLLGQLPLLLARETHDACVVGYGSGVTTHAILTHDVREVVTLELEQAVIDAAPYFRSAALDPLADPRSRLVVDDAGFYLRSTSRDFDAIVNEPSNPWVAGVADLYTREFYAEAARRLRPGGVFCQWIQAYEISPATLGSVLRTLATHLPYGQIFYSPFSADFVVLASKDGPLKLDLEQLDARFARTEVASDLKRIGVRTPADLLRFYRGRLESAVRRSGAGPVNTDDNAWLEHRAPFDLLRAHADLELIPWSNETGEDLLGSLGGDDAALGAALAGALDAALRAQDLEVARGLGAVAVRRGALDAQELERRIASVARAQQGERRIAAILKESVPLMERATNEGNAALGEQAATLLAEAVRLDPSHPEAVWRHGYALLVARRYPEAVEQLRHALEVGPEPKRLEIRSDLAAACFLEGDYAGTLHEAEEMEKLEPGMAEAAYWRAAAHLKQGAKEQARDEVEQALRIHPSDERLLALERELGSRTPP